MNDARADDLGLVARLAAITDAEAGRLAGPGTRADLAARITATPPDAPGGTAGQAGPAGQAVRRSRRTGRTGRPLRSASRSSRVRWLSGLAAACVAVGLAGFVIFGLLQGSHRFMGGVVRAQALAFTRHGRYIDVIVRNPLADARRYRAEFRARGLDISLKLVPASPSLVGTVVYFDGSNAIKTITAFGRCHTGGGGPVCPVGLRVPVHYRGHADFVFGRPARPGERYETTAPSTAPGEALHGLRVAGRRVAAVIEEIAVRHVRVAVYHITTAAGRGEIVRHVPARYFVYEADPWAPGQVMLWVGKTRTPPAYAPGNPAQPSPSPTATPAGSR